MTDDVGYSDVAGVRGSGGSTLMPSLISGELPDGTPVRLPVEIYGVRYPLGVNQNGSAVEPSLVAFEVDNVAPHLVTIPSPHHHAHEGESFYSQHRGDNVASGNGIDMLISVPAGKHPNCVFHFAGTTEFDAYWYKDTTVSANGTAVNMNNRLIGCPKVPGIAVYHTPIVTTAGTVVESERVGSKEAKIGGNRDSGEEWILTEGLYLLRITSRAASNYIKLAVDWYEEGATTP